MIRSASSTSGEATDGRGRQVTRDLGGQVRAGQGGDPTSRSPAGRLDDLAHPEQRVALQPLDHGQPIGPALAWCDLCRDRLQMRGRQAAKIEQVGGAHEDGRIRRGEDGRRQVHARQS